MEDNLLVEDGDDDDGDDDGDDYGDDSDDHGDGHGEDDLRPLGANYQSIV